MNATDKLANLIDNSRLLLNSFPGLILVKDIHSNYIECNEDFSDLIGCEKRDVIGHTDFDLPWADLADIYQRYDREAFNKKELTTLVPLLMSDGSILTSRTYKKPICDEEGNVIGVLGQANILSYGALTKSLFHIKSVDNKDTDLSGYSPISYRVDNYQTELKLTKRESECFFLVIRGLTAKKIGRFLSISSRTVEVHIENIKLKLGVSCKSELISKAMQLGMLDIIPKGEILMNLCANSDKWEALLQE